jgi:biotin carboxyl carrier protein
VIHRFVATIVGTDHEVTVEALDRGRWRIAVDGRSRVIDARRVEGGAWSLLASNGQEGGTARLVDVDGRAPELVASIAGRAFPVKLVEGRSAMAARVAPRPPSGPQPVRAPMPGKVVKVLVKAGEQVHAGQGVAVVEAMKMENELRAAHAGTVAEVNVTEGQAVEAGQPLLTIA